jgi:hypothetical protein
MEPPSGIGRVVAMRALTLTTAAESREVLLWVGLPVEDDGAGSRAPWRCPLAFGGLGADAAKVRPIPGEDSLQALVCALDYARRMLPYYAHRAGGTLSAWDGGFDGDFDVITPNARLIDFYGEASGEALDAVRQAERALRTVGDRELRKVHERLQSLVKKYGEK